MIYVGAAAAGAWNTDADGGHAGALTLGRGPGQAGSTNVQGVPQAIDVSLHFLKGLFVDNESRNLVPGYGGDLGATDTDWPAGYVNTQDFTSPALVEVEVGRFDHDETQANPAAYETIDGKNYFQLKYSEAVDVGGAAGPGLPRQRWSRRAREFTDAELDTRRATVTFGAGGQGRLH